MSLKEMLMVAANTELQIFIQFTFRSWFGLTQIYGYL